MTIAVMQPYVFPYLGYYQLINASDRFIVYDDVAFIKSGWINRNNLLLNGQAHLFSIPLSGASSNKWIADVHIAPNGSWRSKLLATLSHAYRKAPHFAAVSALVEEVLSSSTSIATVATRSLTSVCEYLGLQREFVTASHRYNNTDLTAQTRIIDICKRENAVMYVNAIGGRELYRAEDFEQNGVQLRFLSARISPYPQLGAPFVPALSIIDVLMFNSPQRVREMLGDYELIR